MSYRQDHAHNAILVISSNPVHISAMTLQLVLGLAGCRLLLGLLGAFAPFRLLAAFLRRFLLFLCFEFSFFLQLLLSLRQGNQPAICQNPSIALVKVASTASKTGVPDLLRANAAST